MIIHKFKLNPDNFKRVIVTDAHVKVELKTGEFFEFPAHTTSTREFIRYAPKSYTENGANVYEA